MFFANFLQPPLNGNQGYLAKFQNPLFLENASIYESADLLRIDKNIEFTGSEKHYISTVSTDYTLTEKDNILIVNTASGDKTITLPSATLGLEYTIKNIGIAGYDVVLSGTIDGVANRKILDSDSLTILSTGTEWKITNSFSDFDTKTKGVVFVRKLSDLPTPDINGIIHLENKRYEFQDSNVPITCPYILEFSDQTVFLNFILTLTQGIQIKASGNVRMINGIVNYYGNGTLFYGTNLGSSSRLERVTIIAPYGKVFDLTSSTANSSIVINNVVIGIAVHLGSMTGLIVIMFISQFVSFYTGLVFTNIAALDIQGVKLYTTQPNCTFFDFQGTFNGQISMISFAPTLVSNTQYVFNFNATTGFQSVMVTNSPVYLAGTATEANIFKSGSLDYKTLQFRFMSNVYIPDSSVKADMSFGSSSLQTTTYVIGSKTIINAVWNIYSTERMSAASNGIITYTGLETTTVLVDGNIAVQPNSGIGKEIQVQCMILKKEVFVCTFDNTTDYITSAGHGFTLNDKLCFKFTAGTLPSGIYTDVVYHAINLTTDTFQIAYTSGGSAILFTDNGSGTNSFQKAYQDGSKPIAIVNSGKSVEVIPHALFEIRTNDKLFLTVSHIATTPLQNVIVTDGYLRIKK